MRKFRSGDERWGEFLDIKEFDESSLEKFIRNYKGERVFMSSVTDCYNPFEAKFKKTRKVLEALANSDVKLQILTKSSLVLRDIDLFKTMPNLRVGLSFSTLDENLRAVFEPRASKVNERLNALRSLKEQGVKTFLFVAPIFPAITPALKFAQNYGDLADEIAFDRLNLYPAFKDKILSFIGRNFPHLLSLYKQIYLFNDNSYWHELAANLDEILSSKRANYKIFFKD
ncbi:MAG: radical SAM protein [Campylobacter sp.]|nr:radical SAM protein [Campylobacter sp.]